jgi:outer membrane biosynthesis protein TonB
MSSISPQKSPIHSNRNKAATEEATVAKKRSSTTSKTADKKMPKTQQKKISKDLPLSILEEFDQALAKIEQNSYSKPKQPSSGLEKASIGSFEASVVSLAEAERQTLVDFLHQSLRLPELGEVQIRLTVGRNGTVLKMEVLLAESQKNREYLEQQLPLLHLPLQPIEEKTWIFTFKNEN